MFDVEKISNSNLLLQQSMSEAQSGYQHLYYAALLRGDKKKAEEYREMVLAVTGQLLDLHALLINLNKADTQ